MSKYIYDVKTGKVVLISKITNEVIAPLTTETLGNFSSSILKNFSENQPKTDTVYDYSAITVQSRITANISKGKTESRKIFPYDTFKSKYNSKKI